MWKCDTQTIFILWAHVSSFPSHSRIRWKSYFNIFKIYFDQSEVVFNKFIFYINLSYLILHQLTLNAIHSRLQLNLSSIFNFQMPKSHYIFMLTAKNFCYLFIKILIYKPGCTYGIQLTGIATISNINIIQRFQSMAWRMVTHAPWHVRNDQIHSDLNNNTVVEEIRKSSASYLLCLQRHPNPLAGALLNAD